MHFNSFKLIFRTRFCQIIEKNTTKIRILSSVLAQYMFTKFNNRVVKQVAGLRSCCIMEFYGIQRRGFFTQGMSGIIYNIRVSFQEKRSFKPGSQVICIETSCFQQKGRIPQGCKSKTPRGVQEYCRSNFCRHRSIYFQ